MRNGPYLGFDTAQQPQLLFLLLELPPFSVLLHHLLLLFKTFSTGAVLKKVLLQWTGHSFPNKTWSIWERGQQNDTMQTQKNPFYLHKWNNLNWVEILKLCHILGQRVHPKHSCTSWRNKDKSYWCSSAICFCMSAVYWGPAGLIPINCGWPK